jgi:hypothetical protein
VLCIGEPEENTDWHGYNGCARMAKSIPSAAALTGVDFLASACVPSSVSAIRTPKLPLLPLWEKGAGGMRGKSARECRTSLISPKNSTLECRCKPDGSNAAGSAHLRRAEALAEVGQALRAGSTQVPLAHGQDNRHASPAAGASMRSGRASARCAPAPQGLPRAQGGLQPAAPQPRSRDFHALREGFSPLRPSPAGASTRSGRASARCAPAPQGLPCAQGGLMVFE